MGTFQDWVKEKRIAEVNRLSPEEEAELGGDVQPRFDNDLGMGRNRSPASFQSPDVSSPQMQPTPTKLQAMQSKVMKNLRNLSYETLIEIMSVITKRQAHRINSI